MKDPKKEIIEAGDKVLINKVLYKAVSIKFSNEAKVSCKEYCDLYKIKYTCSKINCRGIYYKRDEGGI